MSALEKNATTVAGLRQTSRIFVVGDGDDDVAVEAFLLLHESSRRAHVLPAAAVQEPALIPCWADKSP
ncbi:hypothetical protein CLOP_g11895 [Closterium sp. NIES-67]|nr:hypothetical protein CLOP_g11895 [Closterium sp. NIES-67]